MFQIDAMSRIPVYEQIVEQMERFVLAGIMKPNDKLPSVRNLSVELSINPNTIQKAYTELDRRGVVCSVPGRGSFVAADAVEKIGGSKRMKLNELRDLMRELKLAGITYGEVEECFKVVFAENEDSKYEMRGGDLSD